MITTITTFQLPKPITRDEAREIFLSTAPKYRDVAGLVRKVYVLSEDGKHSRWNLSLELPRRRRRHVHRELASFRARQVRHGSFGHLLRQPRRGRQRDERDSFGPVAMKARERDDLLKTLQARFEQNMHRHEGVKWSAVQARLENNAKALDSLYEMERTGGEPDMIGRATKAGGCTFCDCAAETPTGRRSVCYDREGLESRKEHRPENSAIEMAAAMGIEMLTRGAVPGSAEARRVRHQDVQLGPDPARHPGPRRRALLRPPLRPGVHVPQRCAVVLRVEGISRLPDGLSFVPRTWRSPRPAIGAAAIERCAKAVTSPLLIAASPAVYPVAAQSIPTTHAARHPRLLPARRGHDRHPLRGAALAEHWLAGPRHSESREARGGHPDGVRRPCGRDRPVWGRHVRAERRVWDRQSRGRRWHLARQLACTFRPKPTRRWASATSPPWVRSACWLASRR